MWRRFVRARRCGVDAGVERGGAGAHPVVVGAASGELGCGSGGGARGVECGHLVGVALVGEDADPSKSREPVLLSVLAERRLEQGQSAELAALIADVLEPRLERIGALAVDDFLGAKERSWRTRVRYRGRGSCQRKRGNSR